MINDLDTPCPHVFSEYGTMKKLSDSRLIKKRDCEQCRNENKPVKLSKTHLYVDCKGTIEEKDGMRIVKDVQVESVSMVEESDEST